MDLTSVWDGVISVNDVQVLLRARLTHTVVVGVLRRRAPPQNRQSRNSDFLAAIAPCTSNLRHLSEARDVSTLLQSRLAAAGPYALAVMSENSIALKTWGP